jgi:hypothetical protein
VDLLVAESWNLILNEMEKSNALRHAAHDCHVAVAAILWRLLVCLLSCLAES